MSAQLEPATLADVHEYLGAGDNSRIPAHRYVFLAIQVQRSAALAARNASGACRALCGIFPAMGGQPPELWLEVAGVCPGEFDGHVYALRRWLGALDGHPATDGLVVRVRPGNRAGETLARALRFRPTGELVDGMQVWRRGRQT